MIHLQRICRINKFGGLTGSLLVHEHEYIGIGKLWQIEGLTDKLVAD